jgi:RimJ/RimL family protein N-acetyltransferase
VPTHGVQLRTSRLLLAPIRDADVAALARHWGEPALARYLWISQPVTLESVAEVVITSERDFAAHGHGVWAVRDPADDSLMGMCGLRQVAGHPYVEILFSLRQRYWGKGLGTEAVFAVLDYAFRKLRLDRIVALVDAENTALVRLVRHAGMAFFTKDGARTYWDVTEARFNAASRRPPPPTEVG